MRTPCWRLSVVLWIIACTILLRIAPVLASDPPRGAAGLEQSLKLLAEKGLAEPLVVVLWVPRAFETVQASPASLEEIARTYGLKVFEQDGIHVLGPAQRRDLSDIAAGRIHMKQSAGELTDSLITSLSVDQLRTAGSPQGLPYGMLARDQQEMLKSIFQSGNVLSHVPADPAQPEMPAGSLPIETVRLHARLDVEYVTVWALGARTGRPDRYGPVGSVYPTRAPATRWELTPASKPESLDDLANQAPWHQIEPPPLVANTLKKSDLDYSDTALRTTVSADGKMSLRELVSVVASRTGLTLSASPGSDQVQLFVHASDVPASSVLRATSLATTGTWRRFGGGYVFVVDNAGLGQIAARIGEVTEFYSGAEYARAMAVSDLYNAKKVLNLLPFTPGSEFALNAEQLTRLDSQTSFSITAMPPLAWDDLTPEQRTQIERKLADEKDLPAETSLRRVTPHVRLRPAFEFPDMGSVFLPDDVRSRLDIFPPWDDAEIGRMFVSDVGRQVRLPLTPATRVCICKPSRSEKPSELVSRLHESGFTALCLRVFTDGYTVFPSAQFPGMPGLDETYFEDLLSQAHAKGMKVFAVVDVLRWSDSSTGHWVDKRKDLLDYDILGRTHAEWAAKARLPDVIFAMEEFIFGEAFTGNAVSPGSEQVGDRLRAMLAELAAYAPDGLMLDYTSMLHPRHTMVSHGEVFGRPGYTEGSKLEMFRKHGIDSIDISTPWSIRTVGEMALYPLVKAANELASKWEDLYREKCDNLLDDLLKEYAKTRSGSPVWIIDTFGIDQASHSWSKFKGRLSGLIYPVLDGGRDGSQNWGFRGMPVFRASENMGTMLFALVLAAVQKQTFEGMPPLIDADFPTSLDSGIVVDLTRAGKKRADYLRLIEQNRK